MIKKTNMHAYTRSFYVRRTITIGSFAMSVLLLERKSLLISAKQGSHWYYFYTFLVCCGNGGSNKRPPAPKGDVLPIELTRLLPQRIYASEIYTCIYNIHLCRIKLHAFLNTDSRFDVIIRFITLGFIPWNSHMSLYKYEVMSWWIVSGVQLQVLQK